MQKCLVCAVLEYCVTWIVCYLTIAIIATYPKDAVTEEAHSLFLWIESLKRLSLIPDQLVKYNRHLEGSSSLLALPLRNLLHIVYQRMWKIIQRPNTAQLVFKNLDHFGLEQNSDGSHCPALALETTLWDKFIPSCAEGV